MNVRLLLLQFDNCKSNISKVQDLKLSLTFLAAKYSVSQFLISKLYHMNFDYYTYIVLLFGFFFYVTQVNLLQRSVTGLGCSAQQRF